MSSSAVDASASAAEAFAKLGVLVAEAQTLTAVCMGVLVWEWIVTLPLEYRLVWKHKLSFINGLCHLNRYGTLAELAVLLILWYDPNTRCERMFHVEGYWHPVMSVVASLILIARAWALWDRSRIVLGTLVSALCAQFIVQMWAVQTEEHPTIPGLSACVRTANYWLYFLLTILTVSRSVVVWMRGNRGFLHAVLLRDAILFFLLYTAANLANMIYYSVSDPAGNRLLLAPLVAAMTSISATRVAFNIRTAAQEALRATTSTSVFRSLPKLNGNGSRSPRHPNDLEASKIGSHSQPEALPITFLTKPQLDSKY